MKNCRYNWKWMGTILSAMFLTMSIAHTAAATEVKIEAKERTTTKVTVFDGSIPSFGDFSRQVTQQQNTLPKINPSPLGFIKDFATNTDFLREVLDAIKAALLAASVPESPMPSPAP